MNHLASSTANIGFTPSFGEIGRVDRAASKAIHSPKAEKALNYELLPAVKGFIVDLFRNNESFVLHYSF